MLVVECQSDGHEIALVSFDLVIGRCIEHVMPVGVFDTPHSRVRRLGRRDRKRRIPVGRDAETLGFVGRRQKFVAGISNLYPDDVVCGACTLLDLGSYCVRACYRDARRA